MIKKYLSNQLVRPSGVIGKYVIGELWNRRNVALNDSTFLHLQANNDDRILEVGFGGGYLLKKILSVVTVGSVAGVDASPIMVEQARKNFRRHMDSAVLHLYHSKAEQLPFSAGYFDKACSANSIFYWPDIVAGFTEIYRVLRANGFFVLTFTGKAYLDKQEFAHPGIRSYADNEVLEALRQAGFRYMTIEKAQDTHRTFAIVKAVK
jgi:ubiquinone/menaquinone biosynthesis C-methylase UbiE